MKMKKIISVVVLMSAFTFFACNKDDDNNNNNNTLSTTDLNFIMQATEGNNAEIGAAQVAITNGNDSAVRAFGQRMVTDHQMAQQSLDSIAGNYGITLTDSVSPQHQAEKDMLMSLSGMAFDSTYINGQITDHTQAIQLYQSELDNGSQPSVKDYVNRYLPVIQMHLQMADSIKLNL